MSENSAQPGATSFMPFSQEHACFLQISRIKCHAREVFFHT